MAADPLSDALAHIDARCVVSGGFSIGGAWGLGFWPRARLKLIAVVLGSCWLTSDGVQNPLRLEEGDVAVLNDRQVVALASDPALEPTDRTDLFEENPGAVVRIGDDQEVLVLGGHIDVNRGGEDLLLTALPPAMHIRASGAEAPAVRWLLDRLAQEMASLRPGATAAAQQYAQLLFVEVLRGHLAESVALPPGWIRVLADERLAPALRLMHADPGRPWHLDDLARSAAMSRTTFAARFKSTAGVPPLTYLHQWRMRLAMRALREEDVQVSSLAASLGYSSESAFSHAFKRTTGIAPRRYRVLSTTPES
ncbi:AraC family transcriptional regulator [Amycolatopsis sp. NPDC051372]|uniref:AraC family transcriptional regulator n=1 Tax=unclassified Amycolatopsis TaxID=2618356 RepID=UPI0034260F14